MASVSATVTSQTQHSWNFNLKTKRPDPAGYSDIDKHEPKYVPLNLQTFIDFYGFLLGIRLYNDFTLLRQP